MLLIPGNVDHVTPDMIDDVINLDPDFWCLFQPYVHLLSGRTAVGLIDTLDVYAVQKMGILVSCINSDMIP